MSDGTNLENSTTGALSSEESSLNIPSSLSSFVATESVSAPPSDNITEMPQNMAVPSNISVSSNISENGLFSQSELQPVTNTEVAPDLPQSTPAPLTSDLNLGQLDILGLDNYKNDLFSDASVGQLPSTQSNNVPIQQSQPPAEYNAPWIVTVSMFWNDLPAIMINNQPFVRLVDIHKQILPAKDTGILKKRCQLMGIEVDNCNEMQRYFLVQYGKAFNSKSTLIISQDNAKDLIGYYVNPQPKTSRPDDHKSIIDHRREQLRRIALARRAAMRAQRSSEKKDDPREIKESDKDPSQDTSLPE